MRPLLLAGGLLSFLAVSTGASAYRPFDGTDAAVAGKGEVELELGPVGYYRLGTQHSLVAPAVILNYGLVDRVELVLQGFNFINVDAGTTGPRDRLLETGFFVKTVLRKGCAQGESGLSLATEVGPLLPTINDQKAFGASVGAIATQCFGRDFIIHYNGAAAITRTPNLDLFGGAILEGPQDLVVRPVAEFYVEREFNVSTTYSALVGAIWRAREKLDLDVGLRAARVNSAGLGEVRLGLTWTFL